MASRSPGSLKDFRNRVKLKGAPKEISVDFECPWGTKGKMKEVIQSAPSLILPFALFILNFLYPQLGIKTSSTATFGIIGIIGICAVSEQVVIEHQLVI